MTTKTKTSKRAALVRLTVACGDDLRFFEIPLRAGRATRSARAEEFQRAVTEAAAAFKATFTAKLKNQRRSSQLRPT
jgi:hypothetical protein